MIGRRGFPALLALPVLAGCAGDAPTAPPPPAAAVVLDLALGEIRTLRSGELLRAFQLQGVDEPRSYVLVVHNPSPSALSRVPLRFQVRRLDSQGAAAATAPPAAVRRAGAEPDGEDREAAVRDRIFQELRRVGARPLRGTGSAGEAVPRLDRSGIARVPGPGDTLRFTTPLPSTGSIEVCSSTERVVGVVRAVGEHFSLVEDTTVAGRLRDGDFADMLEDLETIVFPVAGAYFGTPSDIDGNGRVTVLISPGPNRFGVAGLFSPSDLSDPADCPASNMAEILWVFAPDPFGQFGEAVSLSFYRQRVVGIVAHELQHLINTERRIIVGGGSWDDREIRWLNEGLSHIGEEVSGLLDQGLRAGGNLTFSDYLSTPAGRNVLTRYHLGNMLNVASYLRTPTEVPAISDLIETGAEFSRVRGFGYLFLRWLADRYAPEDSPGLVAGLGEERLFRELAGGGDGLARSTENVVRAVAAVSAESPTWEEIFTEYVAAPVLDDAAPIGVQLSPGTQFATWNLPGMFDELQANGYASSFPGGYPLRPTLLLLVTLPDEPFSTTFDLHSSSAAYFRLEGLRRTPDTLVEVTTPSGAALPGDGILVTITRVF